MTSFSEHTIQISVRTKGIILDIMNSCVSARMSVIRGLRQQKHKTIETTTKFMAVFYALFTVHLSIILDNDLLDTHWLYFTLRLL